MRELSNTAKLSVSEQVFVPILTYGHWFCVCSPSPSDRDKIFAKSSQRAISRQSAQLWNSRSPECWTTSLPNREISATLVRPCDQNAPRKLTRQACWLNPRESGPEVDQGPGEMTTFPTWLSPVLVWSQQHFPRLLKPWGILSPPSAVPLLLWKRKILTDASNPLCILLVCIERRVKNYSSQHIKSEIEFVSTNNVNIVVTWAQNVKLASATAATHCSLPPPADLLLQTNRFDRKERSPKTFAQKKIRSRELRYLSHWYCFATNE